MLIYHHFRFGRPPYLFPGQYYFRLHWRQRRWTAGPRKHGYSRWNFVSTCSICWDTITSGLGGRHIYFRDNTTSGCTEDNAVERLGPENMGIDVGILFLPVLCAEILSLPVWAAAISISGMILLPVILRTTQLNSWPRKHGYSRWNFVRRCPRTGDNPGGILPH